MGVCFRNPPIMLASSANTIEPSCLYFIRFDCVTSTGFASDNHTHQLNIVSVSDFGGGGSLCPSNASTNSFKA